MRSPAWVGLTLDTGALLRLDQRGRARDVHGTLADVQRGGGTICVPVACVAQAWRSDRQVRLARLLRSPDVEIAPLTLPTARAVGLVCARSGHADIVDVQVALCARQRNHAVLTSDPDDLRQVDPGLTVLVV